MLSIVLTLPKSSVYSGFIPRPPFSLTKKTTECCTDRRRKKVGGPSCMGKVCFGLPVRGPLGSRVPWSVALTVYLSPTTSPTHFGMYIFRPEESVEGIRTKVLRPSFSSTYESETPLNSGVFLSEVYYCRL